MATPITAEPNTTLPPIANPSRELAIPSDPTTIIEMPSIATPTNHCNSFILPRFPNKFSDPPYVVDLGSPRHVGHDQVNQDSKRGKNPEHGSGPRLVK